MKRLFCFLAVLLSTHYLIAKTPIKAQSTGTNQNIGCRLQGTGAEIASPSEDEISQEAKIIANRELPTLNSHDEGDK
ncbi:MAG TPA: hypothetical protein VJK54_07705 [Chthoniobacterales bacterium]|nr:hypothetical protein [Chthoniobacterales bacterium]